MQVEGFRCDGPGCNKTDALVTPRDAHGWLIVQTMNHPARDDDPPALRSGTFCSPACLEEWAADLADEPVFDPASVVVSPPIPHRPSPYL